MSQYDKGRYYWIKLTDRFMTSDTVDFLMSQKDGANYVVLYQMLCLKTVNNNGIMARTLGEVIVPFDIEKIQRDCKWFSHDTVRVALELYKKLGLIYENNDGVLAISNFDRLIGSQTYGAEKKELQRLESGQKVDIRPPEKEIKRIRDKEKKKEDKSLVIKHSNAMFTSEFEEVWKFYPNKQGKEKSRNCYIKARKDGITREEIESGVKKYAEYCKVKGIEKQYIKHGDTWFGNKSWQDDYDITKGATNEVAIPKYSNTNADDALERALARSNEKSIY